MAETKSSGEELNKRLDRAESLVESLDFLINGAWILMGILDPAGTILFCNRPLALALGADCDDIEGKYINSVLEEKPAADITEHLNTCLSSKDKIEFETGMNGRFYSCRISPLESGRAILALEDITARRKAEAAIRDSESRYRVLFEHASDGILIADLEKKQFRFANPAVCRMFGYSLDEITQLSVNDIHPAESLPMVILKFEMQARGEILVAPDLPCLKKDGSIFYADISTTSAVLDGVPCNIGFFREVTDRHSAIETIKKERDRAQRYLTLAGVMFVAINRDGNVTLINRKGCEILGWAEEELLGRNWFDTCVPESMREMVKGVFGKIINGEITSLEYYDNPIITKSGGERIIEWHNTILKDENERVTGTLSSGEDVTERKRTEENLRLTEARLQAIFDHTPNIAIEGYDIGGRVLYWNKAAEKMFGWPREEALGKTLDQLILDPASMQEFKATLFKLDRSGESFGPSVWTCNSRSGGFVAVYSTIFPITAGDGSKEFICMDVDVTERVGIEEALKESEEKFRSIVDHLPLGMHLYEIMPDGGLVFTGANPEADRILGIKHGEFIGKTIEEAFPSLAETEVPERYRLAAAEGIPWHTVNIDYKDEIIAGAFEVYAFRTSPGRMAAVFSDITEKKKTEAELDLYRLRLEELVWERTKDLEEAHGRLIASERLAVVGQLSGSVAHEIRNPLAVISNSVYLLRKKIVSDDEKVKLYLEKIGEQVNKSAAIIESILRLTKSGDVVREKTDLAAIVEESIHSVGAAGHLRFHTEYPSVPYQMMIDGEQFGIVFRNLVRNSLQAMIDGGDITISVREIEANGGGQSEIIFKDTGPGISEKDLEKVFTPLFTSKARGMGLGLTIVKMIVENHGGTITAASSPGDGMKFTILLPLGTGKSE